MTGSSVKFTARGGGANWRGSDVSLSWKSRVEKPGTYQVDLVTTETGSHGSPIWEGGQKLKSLARGNRKKQL